MTFSMTQREMDRFVEAHPYVVEVKPKVRTIGREITYPWEFDSRYSNLELAETQVYNRGGRVVMPPKLRKVIAS